MADQNFEMTKALSTSKNTATKFLNVLLDHWIVPCGIPDHLLTNTFSQSVFHRSTSVSPFSLVLSRNPTWATPFDLPSAVSLNLPGNEAPCILRSHRSGRLVLVREKFDSPLTAAKKWCKVDFDEHVRKAPIFTNKKMIVDRPLFAVSTNSSKTTDKTAYEKFLL